MTTEVTPYAVTGHAGIVARELGSYDRLEWHSFAGEDTRCGMLVFSGGLTLRPWVQWHKGRTLAAPPAGILAVNGKDVACRECLRLEDEAIGPIYREGPR